MDLSKYSFNRRDRYSAKRSIKVHNFSIQAPDAKEVCVVGDFNQWDPTANPLTKQIGGGWLAQVPMHHGHHRYIFLIDGVPTLDHMAHGIVRNENNERLSLIAIS